MPPPLEPPSPDTRARAQVRLRRLTRAAVVGATGATALIAVAVAREHPGSTGAPGTRSASAGGGAASAATSTRTSTRTSSGRTTATTAPTTTTTVPTVTSGGTSR